MKISDILGHTYDCLCLGCAIASGEISPPGEIIASTPNFVLHQDPEVPIKGFLIVASRKHIHSIADMSQKEVVECFNLVYRARIALRNLKDISDVSIIQEEGSAHFHIWLRPHYEWMEDRFDHSLSTLRAVNQYARENLNTVESIQEILAAVELIRKEVKG